METANSENVEKVSDEPFQREVRGEQSYLKLIFKILVILVWGDGCGKQKSMFGECLVFCGVVLFLRQDHQR